MKKKEKKPAKGAGVKVKMPKVAAVKIEMVKAPGAKSKGGMCPNCHKPYGKGKDSCKC